MQKFEQPKAEQPKEEDSIDIDVSEFDEEVDPATREVNENVESGHRRILSAETVSQTGPEAEAQKAVMNEVVDDLMNQRPFSTLFEGKEGVRADFEHELKRDLAGEMQKYLDTGKSSPIELRMTREELYRTLLRSAGESAKPLLKKYEDKLLGGEGRMAA